MKFLLACAGTAGHINPALAVAGRLRELMPDAAFLFAGSGRELENRLIPAAGFPIENIKITGLARGLSAAALRQNLRLVRVLHQAGRQSREMLLRFRPDAVIGTGGYVCYPVLKQAAAMGIPTLLHESNAVPGLTTRLLSGMVDAMLVAFPNVAKYYRHPEKVQVTGTPVRAGFAHIRREEAREKLGLGDRKLAVSFWGSLGATRMNEIMADFIARDCRERKFSHIHATGGGEEGRQRMLAMLQSRGVTSTPPEIDIRAYIDDMDTVMTAADLVLCRAGASTIAELTAMGKPSLLVPSPNVTGNHQEKNARALERKGAAAVLTEEECTGPALYEKVCALLADPAALETMGRAAAGMGAPDSADRIVEIILSLLTQREKNA